MQITPTDSGLSGALLYENRHRCLGNGERLLEKEHLAIFLNPLQLEIQTLLLNCSFYGYRHLHQKLFESPAPPPRTCELCSRPSQVSWSRQAAC